MRDALARTLDRALPLAALALALLCAATPARAADVPALYEGRVEVAAEDDAARLDGLGRALRQVVGKLTGVAEPGGPVIDAAAGEPDRFVQQFRFLRPEQPGEPLRLWASFDAAAVDALVRDAGLPKWGAQRPRVLAWVAVRRDGATELVATDIVPEVSRAVSAAAWQRGVPLQYPLLDLEDRVRLQADDVWAMDELRIAAASERYGAGLRLVGRIERLGDGAWQAHWALLDDIATAEWSASAASAGAAAAAGIDVLADRLAARYAIGADVAAGGRIELRVSGVRSLEDYARAFGYLAGLDQTSGLRLRAARSDELVFSLEVLGGADALRRVASFGGVLAPDAGPADPAVVRFRLQP